MRNIGRTGNFKRDTVAKPDLVKCLEQLMDKQGIEYYEKNVSNQLIEFMHYYVTETI
jgi:hypothetical protein